MIRINDVQLIEPVVSFLNTFQCAYEKEMHLVSSELVPALLRCQQRDDERLATQCHFILRRLLLSSPFCVPFAKDLVLASRELTPSSPCVLQYIEYIEIMETFDADSLQPGRIYLIKALKVLKRKTDDINRYRIAELMHRLEKPSKRRSSRSSTPKWFRNYTRCVLCSLIGCALLSLILLFWFSPTPSRPSKSPNFDSTPIKKSFQQADLEIVYDDVSETVSAKTSSDEVFQEDMDEIDVVDIDWSNDVASRGWIVLLVVGVLSLVGYLAFSVDWGHMAINAKPSIPIETSHAKRKASHPKRLQPKEIPLDMSSVAPNEDSVSGGWNRFRKVRF